MSLLRISENTFCESVILGVFIISVSQPLGLLLTVLSNHLQLSQKSVPEKSSRLKKCVLIMSEIRGEGGKKAGKELLFSMWDGSFSIYC